ncbi:hypothetical protein [Bifidobacterium aemilianum]|uniref:hypothetical protein n=1 Tax=Bifidobacterium aemilianum TaxID=2493120 RepID=UPI000FDEDEFE|nr:hypothetical protein [Bifidobacterium aemilianum]
MAYWAVDPYCKDLVTVGENTASNRDLVNACGRLTFIHSFCGGHEGAKLWKRVQCMQTMAGLDSTPVQTAQAVTGWVMKQSLLYAIMA